MNSDTMLNPEQCWQAVVAKDAAQDGQFYFGVRTTGVYCRPSCAARRPLRNNVEFYASPEDAERAGLRPCRRCHPRESATDAPTALLEICQYIDQHADEPLKLDDLARRAGLNRFRFHRMFRAQLGITPREYVEAARLSRLKGSLRTCADVTEAIYDAGFGSSSRVYERADTRLGMTPKQYRMAGKDVVITYATADTCAGLIMVGATDRGLCFVHFGEDEASLLAELKREYPSAQCVPMRRPESAAFRTWMHALRAHLEGRRPRLDLPLDVRATAFQMRVWNYLQKIPYGEVQSYSEVAQGIGDPKAIRAVARACAGNRLALVIPCHRVIRGTGELGGYRWGLARKRLLIDRERAAAAKRS